MRLFLILFFLSVSAFSTVPLSYAKSYCVNLSQDEEKILEDIIIDIQDWIALAVLGKVNKSEEHIIRKEISESIKEGSGIPDSKADIINKRFNRPGYKNRKERQNQGNNP